ncbi:MAG: hypothetical protein B7Z33_07710 [Sphingomonadales bacterium 12-68-11]|nr:MAG: hypothetical protein B7Z33_07710 [Sphingomonadales bacterium 12-68-11]
MSRSARPSPSLSWALLAALLGWLFLWLAAPASAHPVPFSYVDVELADNAIEGRVRFHLTDAAPILGLVDPEELLRPEVVAAHRAQIERYLEDHIKLDGRYLTDVEWGKVAVVDANEALEFSYRIPGKQAGALNFWAHLFPSDGVHQTFVNVYDSGTLRQQWIFASQSQPQTYYRGTTAGVLAVMGTFVPSGVHHIAGIDRSKFPPLVGPDHLLFLFGLILLGGGWKRLLVIVTAFTLGHSVTLSLAALDIVTLPGWIVEPAIALSIVVVGVDNLLQRRGHDEGRDLRAWVAAVFGLIHGFGFASVLKEFGLPAEALGWSLFSFNLGVEIGQLAVVAVIVSLLALVRRWSPARLRQIETIGSIAVIAGGAYWFVQRVFWGG